MIHGMNYIFIGNSYAEYDRLPSPGANLTEQTTKLLDIYISIRKHEGDANETDDKKQLMLC